MAGLAIPLIRCNLQYIDLSMWIDELYIDEHYPVLYLDKVCTVVSKAKIIFLSCKPSYILSPNFNSKLSPRPVPNNVLECRVGIKHLPHAQLQPNRRGNFSLPKSA